MKYPTIALAAAVIALAAASFSPATADDRPVVVELFTSQGCSSCPPADKVLGEFAERPDVLALSFHVTYWDRLGWPDVFGLEAATERQYTYAEAMGEERVYTPQMVIDGRVDLVGSRRAAALEIIQVLKDRRTAGPDLRLADGGVMVGAGEGSATVWLVAFDDRRDVQVERGENAGRTLRYHNVVRDVRPLGRWHGADAGFALDEAAMAGHDGAAVLLQADDGRILSALRIEPAA